jgi:ABC-type sugar transport system ATPase subunit
LVRHAGRTVLARLSLSVSPGETVVVAGASGFGGTTLARVIAGTVQPDSGQVWVADEDITDAEPAQRRRVGYLPAGGGLLPHVSTESNIRYGMRLRGESEPWRERRLGDVVRALDLGPSLRLRPHELSPGGRFRAAIARIAVRDPFPTLWVVDGTQGGHVRGLRELLSRVRSKDIAERPAVLICAHDGHTPAVIDEADLLLVVQGGKIVRSGVPRELRADPPDLLTARLTLSPPLPVHTGRVSSQSIECGPLVLPCPSWLTVGGQVSVVLPGRALSLHSAPGIGHIAGQMVDVKPEGTRARVTVEPEPVPRDRWLVDHPVDDWWPRPQGSVGVSVGVRVDPELMLIFDAETGDRIRQGEEEPV